MISNIPNHLKKYIVEQNYDKYTPVDQACWRFILRQLKAFLGKNAHQSYLDGLEKTGIEIERIPRISDISCKIEQFGWRALPVSGFIPPAAFMELQSLGVLPIASDMRSLDHLMYTPAPDIVHEAAGHAPMLINEEYAAYLGRYAEVAKMAIVSHEDLALYEAIRVLSDLKESANSSPAEIAKAQTHLEDVAKNMSHTSEASLLARMNWWTAEYGLVGPMDKPKIFGAGLLSSVGEARWCLSKSVKKIPLTVACVQQNYDITEPQPQLFVTPDFNSLCEVLEELSNSMSFRTGGLSGIEKAIQAKTVNTVELDSGIQISSQAIEVLAQGKNISYLRFQGPTQLCFEKHELDGHDVSYHAHGFGSPIGFLKSHPNKDLSQFSDSDFSALGLQRGQQVQLEFASGVIVAGKFKGSLHKMGKTILLIFTDCKVTAGERVLFEPSWGTYDMAVGSQVTSVFAGPADRESFGETDDFVAKCVPLIEYSSQELIRHRHYQKLRDLREGAVAGPELEQALTEVFTEHEKKFPKDWLLSIEGLELLKNRCENSDLITKIEAQLHELGKTDASKKEIIEDGLALAYQAQ